VRGSLAFFEFLNFCKPRLYSIKTPSRRWLSSLAAFVIAGAPAIAVSRLEMEMEPLPLLHAAALMFVAYTGYGRIATLGEEVVEPQRTIPRSIIVTLAVSMCIYIAVAVVAVGAAGADRLEAATAATAAPLEVVSRDFPLRIHWLVAIGAMTAMLGVLLNLLLGLSRVLLAMGRRGDMPPVTANVTVSVVVVAAAMIALIAVGSIKTTWSFSAFTVLIYYAITNLAALRLPKDARLYAKAWAWAGLTACLALAFAIDWQVWTTGLAILGFGFLWHWNRSKRD
jgi:APA family basic amino acid/polyamine antiporter